MVARSEFTSAELAQQFMRRSRLSRTQGNVTRQIGKTSANGLVFELSKANRVVKVIPYGKANEKKINREKNFQKRLGNKGIAPKVLAYSKIRLNAASRIGFNWNSNKNGVALLVMNHLKRSPTNVVMSVANYMNHTANGRLPAAIKAKLNARVKAMHRNGIFHANLHMDNVYLILDNNGVLKNVKIIDFGRSIPYRGREKRMGNLNNTHSPAVHWSSGNTGRRCNFKMMNLVNARTP